MTFTEPKGTEECLSLFCFDFPFSFVKKKEMSKGNDGDRGGIGELQSQHQSQCVSTHKVESLDSKGNVLAHIKQK